MSRKFPVGGFKQVENAYQFDKNFTENYNKDNDEEYFLEVS